VGFCRRGIPSGGRLLSIRVGYVSEIDALVCGNVTHRMGSGRHAPEDDIDYTTGLKLLVSVGSKVSKGKSLSHRFLQVFFGSFSIGNY